MDNAATILPSTPSIIMLFRCSGGWQVPQARDCLRGQRASQAISGALWSEGPLPPPVRPRALALLPCPFPASLPFHVRPVFHQLQPFFFPFVPESPFSPRPPLLPAPTEVKQSPPSPLDPVPDPRSSLSLSPRYLSRSLFLLILSALLLVTGA